MTEQEYKKLSGGEVVEVIETGEKLIFSYSQPPKNFGKFAPLVTLFCTEPFYGTELLYFSKKRFLMDFSI